MTIVTLPAFAVSVFLSNESPPLSWALSASDPPPALAEDEDVVEVDVDGVEDVVLDAEGAGVEAGVEVEEDFELEPQALSAMALSAMAPKARLVPRESMAIVVPFVSGFDLKTPEGSGTFRRGNPGCA
jgi:hypothetical protein